VGAVIVAAGKGERMGGVDKMFALLGGKPVLARVVETFQMCGSIDQIVVDPYNIINLYKNYFIDLFS
jgi:2-C-methyl-D-erythritol 4-phosphate cytidylyltransferase